MTVYEVAMNLRRKDRAEVHREGCRAAKTARRSGLKVYRVSENRLRDLAVDYWAEVDDEPETHLFFHNCTK